MVMSIMKKKKQKKIQKIQPIYREKGKGALGGEWEDFNYFELQSKSKKRSKCIEKS